MGSEPVYLLSPEYVLLESFESELFGEVSRVAKGGQTLLSKVIVCADAEERQKVCAFYAKRKALSYPGLVRILQVKECAPEERVCSKGLPLVLLFQDCPLTFEAFLQSQSRQFGEEDGLRLIRQLYQGVRYLYEQNLKNIYLGRRTLLFLGDQPKLVDNSLSKLQHPYFRVLRDRSVNSEHYLPPESIQNIASGYQFPEINIKSEIYSIGVLAVMLLARDSLRSCYSESLGHLEQGALRRRIGTLGVSEDMQRLLESMTDGDIANRIQYYEIEQLLLPQGAGPEKQVQKSQVRSVKESESASTHHQRLSQPSEVEVSKFSYGGVKLAEEELDYEGRLVGGLKEGFGTLTKGGQLVYKGKFHLDKYEGLGFLFNLNAEGGSPDPFDLNASARFESCYEGEFRGGLREGPGSLLYQNGDKFTGLFRGGKAKGLGIFEGRRRLQGIWEDGLFAKR